MRQHSYIGSVTFPMEEMSARIEEFADPRRGCGGVERARARMKAFRGIVRRIADEGVLSDDELREDPCYAYFMSLRPAHRNADRRCMELMRQWNTLYYDIQERGLRAPLDMFRIGQTKLVLNRGWRRFAIMEELHRHDPARFATVAIRLFKDLTKYRWYMPDASVPDSDSIHALGMDQFAQYGALATDKYWVHDYTKLYDRHFAHLRDKPVKLLEIGVLRGASLLLWRAAFPNGSIFGLDKNATSWRTMLDGTDRIKVFVGNQQDSEFLTKQVGPAGPYDIIIDDGGHTPDEQIASYRALWPFLAPHGIYVIEDLHGNYWDRRAKNGPLMMDAIRGMIDDVAGVGDVRKMRSLCCYYNICFMEKL